MATVLNRIPLLNVQLFNGIPGQTFTTETEARQAVMPRRTCLAAIARLHAPCSAVQPPTDLPAVAEGRSCAALLQPLPRGWLPSHRPVVLAPVPPPPPAAVAGAAATSASPGAAPGEPPSAVSEMVPVTSDRSVKPMEWSMATWMGVIQG